jgi:long-chain fatty acid transport protein
MQNRLALCQALAVILLCFLVAAPQNVFGSGFGIFTQDAVATGLVSSVTAHSDAPSSVFFNPALINGLEGTQVELGTTLVWPTQEFASDSSGSEFKTRNGLFYPSHFYITHKVNQRVSVGLGVFNNFGLATKWDDSWEGRYLATNSELTVFTFNPVVSIKVTDKLSVAAGIDFLTLDVTLEKKINLMIFPDANQKFKGDGSGAGFNLGILYDLTKDISLGASYRSHIKTRIKGDVTHSLPPGSEAYFGPYFPNTHAESDLTFPDLLNFGVAYRGIRNLVLEADLHFEDWSSFKEQRIFLSQPVAGLTTIIAEKNWKNTWAFGVGSDYRVNDSVSLLAGYLHSGNPIPDETFEPAIPDSDFSVFNVGTELRYKAVTVGLSYGYQLSEERRKRNSIDDNPYDGVINPDTSANGKYNAHVHVLSMGLTFRL